jgi:FecR protein
MAMQPPPLPATTATPAAPPAGGRSGCFGRGCGCSLLGCLGIFVLAGLLVLGGGYWFFVVQAQAAVTAPATLVVYTQPVTVDGRPGIAGQALKASDQVATQDAGHVAVQFPDGSYVRMAPGTTLKISSIQLKKTGELQSADIVQKVGRTFVNVQHLVSGSTFKVHGHSVTAEVRGTQFELLARADNSSTIKVFDGTVTVAGKQTRRVSAGQEVDVDANGDVSAPHASTRDLADPFALTTQCARAIATGTTPGTLQTSAGALLSTGQASEVDYDSPGGTISVALCYPGSIMSLTVIDPRGASHTSRNGGPPVKLNVAGPAGRYRAVVRALSVSPAEAFVVAFATDAPCVAGSSDTGTSVRQTLSNSQIAAALAESGQTGVSLQVQGTSAASARIHYYSNVAGVEITWTVVFYAATPNLGANITQVTVRGINVTTQVLRYFGSVGASSISSIPSGFIVDRVYSCAAASGDRLMVIEGHR